jgi:2-phosphoglycerate kinase
MKHIILPMGYKKTISPMFIIGNLIASGIEPAMAPALATTIIDSIPENGISENGFFIVILQNLPEEARRRFVILDMMKKFLVSPKSKSPLFMFLGGFTGKTFLTSYLQQHLGINRVISMDDEKYIVRNAEPSATHLWKSTYEESDVYEKTVQSLYPRIKERIDTNIHDYESHKKWTFFWEGIYFTADLMQKLKQDYPQIEFFTVLLIPPFDQIKERYIVRWMSELGRRYIQNNQAQIEKYIQNVEHIQEVMLNNIGNTDIVIIKEPYFDTVLELYYNALTRRLLELAEKNSLTEWIDKVVAQPELLQDYETFLDA